VSTLTLDLTNPWGLIPGMLAMNPAAVVALPVFVPHDPSSTLIITAKRRRQAITPEIARQLVPENTPAHELPTHVDVGRLLLTIPSDVAMSFRGPASGRHVAYLVLVAREAYDEAERQAKSGIVLAGPQDIAQVTGAARGNGNGNPHRANGPLIVKP
jgi:hypothetical protein